MTGFILSGLRYFYRPEVRKMMRCDGNILGLVPYDFRSPRLALIQRALLLAAPTFWRLRVRRSLGWVQ
jgi:hypothetical protein